MPILPISAAEKGLKEVSSGLVDRLKRSMGEGYLRKLIMDAAARDKRLLSESSLLRKILKPEDIKALEKGEVRAKLTPKEYVKETATHPFRSIARGAKDMFDPRVKMNWVMAYPFFGMGAYHTLRGPYSQKNYEALRKNYGPGIANSYREAAKRIKKSPKEKALDIGGNFLSWTLPWGAKGAGAIKPLIVGQFAEPLVAKGTEKIIEKATLSPMQIKQKNIAKQVFAKLQAAAEQTRRAEKHRRKLEAARRAI